MPSLHITLKRAYLPPSEDDGMRILVERLWPRGLTREKAAIDHWPKDIAPSPDLRKWYGHVPERWAEFQRRYRAELQANEAAVADLENFCAKRSVTFVFAARDEDRNGAVVLRDYLMERAGA